MARDGCQGPGRRSIDFWTSTLLESLPYVAKKKKKRYIFGTFDYFVRLEKIATEIIGGGRRGGKGRRMGKGGEGGRWGGEVKDRRG